MGVPTITTITPSSTSAASMEMVRIDGTNFNVPAIPVPTAQYPGVRVWFNDIESDNVKPVTSAIMYVQAPRYLGDPADMPDTVDVRIANIDATGAIIAGEDVTFPNAFTYSIEAVRTPTGTPFWILAIREMILEFKRQTGLDVHFAVHPDYEDEVALEYFEAEPPCIGVRDLNVRDYPYHDQHGREDVEVAASQWGLYRDTDEAEFDASMILVCNNKDELFRYFDLVRKMGARVKYLYVPKDDATPTDRARIKLRIDPDGDFAVSYRQVLASMAFTATLGPCPIETPEILDRAWEAVTLVYDIRNTL